VRRQTELAQLEADRKQKELIASTIRPAEAEAEAQIRRAEGDKGARIAAAQADAERVKLAGQAEASVQVVKGEAQARVTLVNAEAIAKQTTLEGNAEAGITFTKGEAEAKALALRAEAYRQFNDAAIISTVLSMLPEIVRAAAEPLAAIDNLTVLSSEGASEIVKTTTRTLAEASATVKGLTGIDIPALLNSALGQDEASPAAKVAAAGAVRRRRPDDEGGGGGGRAGGEPGPAPEGGPGPAPEGGPGPAPAGGASTSSASATDASGSSSASAPAATPAASTPAPEAPAPPPPAETPEQRFAKAAASMHAATTRATAPSAKALAGLRSQLPPMPTVTDLPRGDKRRVASAAVTAAGLSEGSTLSESAVRLAEELQRIPGIEKFGGTRLRDLERSGPRTLRSLWSVARDDLQARYGDVTIGVLLDAYEKGTGAGTGSQDHKA
jgi:hypothetical protein